VIDNVSRQGKSNFVCIFCFVDHVFASMMRILKLLYLCAEGNVMELVMPSSRVQSLWSFRYGPWAEPLPCADAFNPNPGL
jgi:hypothetical protein